MANDYAAARLLVDRILKEQQDILALRDALKTAELAQDGAARAQRQQKDAETATAKSAAELMVVVGEIAEARADIAHAQAEQARLAESTALLERQVAELQAQADHAHENLLHVSQELRDHQDTRDRVVAELGALRREGDRVRAEQAQALTALKAERDAVATELDALKARFLR